MKGMISVDSPIPDPSHSDEQTEVPTLPPGETEQLAAPTKSSWNPTSWSLKAKIASAGVLGVIALAALLAVVLSPSTIVVHGIISATSVNAPILGSSGTCSLPTSPDQLLLKADGVVVDTAQLGKSHYKTESSTASGVTIFGCYAWERFTFRGVPAGRTIYEITIARSSGCRGTLYFKPAQLTKPIGLSCS